jgi:hypothetical protein
MLDKAAHANEFIRALCTFQNVARMRGGRFPFGDALDIRLLVQTHV